jgi:glycosyltransferase involved in cell wall biosynthesis
MTDLATGVMVPRVSVIIPCYNTAKYVGEALDSLARQTFRDFETILVNDGSPDTPELERVLEPYRGGIVYLVQENRGPSAARNTAIKAAKGEYIGLLDSDDYWEPEYLSTLVTELDQHRDLDVVFPDARIVGDAPESGRTIMEMNRISGDITIESLLSEEAFVFVAALARRDVLIEAGLFDEDFYNSEDFDLWIRVLAVGGRIGFNSTVLTNYRRRAESLTTNTERMLMHHMLVWDKMEQTLALTPAETVALQARRSKTAAAQHLARARAAFAAGEYPKAREELRYANRTYRAFKLDLIAHGLAICPGLLWQLHQLRDRLIFGSRTLYRP